MTRENKVFFSSLVAGAVAFSAMFAVVACGTHKPEQSKPAASGGDELMEYDGLPSTSVHLWKDPDTGCEYLYASGGYVLHPRIASDGMTHRGCLNPHSPAQYVSEGK